MLNSDVERSIDNQEFHTWEENAKLIAWKCLADEHSIIRDTATKVLEVLTKSNNPFENI